MSSGADDGVPYLWCGSPADSFTIGNRSADAATQPDDADEDGFEDSDDMVIGLLGA